MADIGALIQVMQNSLKEVSESVEQGQILTSESVTALLQLQQDLAQIRTNDIRNEVLRGTKLKELSAKWNIGSGKVCQIHQEKN